MWRVIAPLLVVSGAGSRGPQPAQVPAEKHASVGRLLLLVDQSVRGAQGDAEMIFASLFSYDHQLEQSLTREMSSMNETLAKLTAVRSSYLASIATSSARIERLGAAAQSSEQSASLVQAATARTGGQFESLLGSVASLLRLLRSAKVTPQGALALPGAQGNPGEPARVHEAIRELLTAHSAALQPHFADVLAAFAPVAGVPLGGRPAPPLAKMTPALLQRTLLALSAVDARLDAQRQRSVQGLAARAQGLAAEAASAQVEQAEQRGVQAETEHAMEDLSFSMAFTEAVWKMDRELRSKVELSMKSKADVVEHIRTSCQAQLKMLGDLVELLGAGGPEDRDGTPSGPSFLEVRSSKEYPKDSLLFEIETALHHKADTHGILMRIKGMMDEAAAVDATSTVNVVQELGSVMQTLDDDQARANAAKERCEAQRAHSAREEQDVKANLALMASVQRHTQAAMAAARSNLDRIAAKAKALQTSTKTFSRAVAHAMRTLRGHSNDRGTIMAAVQRAKGALGRSQTSSRRAAVERLARLHEELEAQEQWENQYRSQESSLSDAFLEYARDYQELLSERRTHYERSLSALELYGSEVAGDMAEQSGALGTSGELEKESQDLCDGILKFYSSFHQRRLKLIDTLKDLLPRMPELVRSRTSQS